MRVRLNGHIHELDEMPPIERNRRHTIEAVVDRFRVRGELQLRLAESVETALALGDSRVRVAWMDDEPRSDLVFSAKFACPICDYSLPELEPRLFSFNNPAGACGKCDGLGVNSFFDPARVVGHPELSLPGGAVRGWDRRNAYYFQMVQALATHYEFDLDSPFRDLPDHIRSVVLFGSEGVPVRFTYFNDRQGSYQREHPFEGIIPNMDRRYRETESNVVREELAKYLGSRPCETCGGTRLNQAARHVYVGDRNLPAITAMPVEGRGPTSWAWICRAIGARSRARW